MDKIWLKSYQPGVPAEINPDAYHSLVDFFNACCSKYRDLPALSNFNCKLTHQQLFEASRAFAAYLQNLLGLKKGERFAIMLPNLLQYPVALFGALQAGLIVVNVNPLYTPTEVAHQINNAQAETIIVLANYAHVVEKALPQTSLKNIIVTEVGDLLPFVKATLINFVVNNIRKQVPQFSIPQAILFKKALKIGKRLDFTDVLLQGEDTAFLQYTGGTTGIAKGAILTHRNMLANIEQVVAWIKPTFSEGCEVIITPLPLYHIFSLTANCLSFLHFGALNVLITDPRDIPNLVKTYAKQKVTAFSGVNTLFNALLNNPDFVKLDFKHLKIALGGGAAVQTAVAQRWQQVTGKTLYEGYGLTETSPVVCVMPLNNKEHIGSIGLPISSTDVSVRDNDNHEVVLGELGELCVKGPQVMQGYWNNAAEAQHIFTEDGWLKTGDIVRMDVDGFLYLEDRKKDMIIVSGFNVYPNEIENAIAAHPAVAEVAVIGVPSATTGEAVKAFVIKKDPLLTADALIAFCRQTLTGYKLPKLIEFRDSLPKSNVGKILRKALRDAA